MNQMADLVKGFAGKAEMPTKHWGILFTKLVSSSGAKLKS